MSKSAGNSNVEYSLRILGNLNFPALFVYYFGTSKSARNFKLIFPKCRNMGEIQFENVKVWNFLKFPKCQKMRENSNSLNSVANATISKIICALGKL